MFTGQRAVAMALVICFVAGEPSSPTSIEFPSLSKANLTQGMGLFAVVNFFPLLYSTVFPADPVQVGLKTLAPSMMNNVGAIIFNTSLSAFKKHNREVLLVATIIMSK